MSASVSLPTKLVTLLLALSGALLVLLIRVHRNAEFSSPDPRGGYGDGPDENNPHSTRGRREKEDTVKNPKPLNVLLFYADDWRHDTLGAAGNPIVKTPVLDALAAEGVRFTENCVTTSVCWVSRATLYSGQYLARHHFEMLKKGRTVAVNGTPTPMGFEVPQNETLYALLKRKARYVVGHAGKIGLWTTLNRWWNFDFMTDDDGWHWRTIGNRTWHITEKNTADALYFLTRRDMSRPFFLNIAYFATHAVDGHAQQYLPQNKSMGLYANATIPVPATATEEAWQKMPPFFGETNEGRVRWRWRFNESSKHQRMMRNYYRMASEVDTSVGIILKHVEMQGQLNDTLVIFTTDNGNFHAEHGLADKWYPHQESIRVPLIIKDPRMSPEFKGTTNDEFTLNVDLTATILAAAGMDPLPSMMGRDMSVLYRNGGLPPPKTAHARRAASGLAKQRRHPKPAADGGGQYHSGSARSWRTEFFYEHPMHTHPQYIPASEALVRKDYKYFYWPDFGYEQLFDLRRDPGELHDLRNSTDPRHRKKLKDMRKRFLELKALAYSNLSIIL